MWSGSSTSRIRSRREQVVVPRGMRYNERPIKGGQAHTRDVIIHERPPARPSMSGRLWVEARGEAQVSDAGPWRPC